MAGTTLCWPGDSGRSRINLLARDSSHQQRGRLPRLPRCLWAGILPRGVDVAPHRSDRRVPAPGLHRFDRPWRRTTRYRANDAGSWGL